MGSEFFEVISTSLTQRWLFAAELLVAEILANLRLEKRAGFAWRAPVAVALYFLVGFLFPENIGSISLGARVTYIVFCFSVLFNWLCFDEKWKRIIFNCVGAYGLQGLVNNLSICVRQIFGVPSEWHIPLDIAACAVIYYAGYFLLFRNQEEIEDRSDNIKILLLSVVVFLATDVMAKVAANQGLGDNLLIRASLSISIILALFFQFQLMKASKLEQEKQKMENLLVMEQEQYRLSRETIDAVNRKCHDLKHQIRDIRKGLSDADTAEALEEMETAVMFYDRIAKTGNDALDSILTEKSLVCERFHIQFNYMADGKLLSFIRHVDLYALLGNALDNAIESVQKEEEAIRMIFLDISRRGETLSIHLENGCKAEPQFRDGLPLTTKSDKENHGIGTKSIAYIVKKYAGNTVFGWSNGLFTLDVMIPVP